MRITEKRVLWTILDSDTYAVLILQSKLWFLHKTVWLGREPRTIWIWISVPCRASIVKRYTHVLLWTSIFTTCTRMVTVRYTSACLRAPDTLHSAVTGPATIFIYASKRNWNAFLFYYNLLPQLGERWLMLCSTWGWPVGAETCCGKRL
jgi:hypothetical protein